MHLAGPALTHSLHRNGAAGARSPTAARATGHGLEPRNTGPELARVLVWRGVGAGHAGPVLARCSPGARPVLAGARRCSPALAQRSIRATRAGRAGRPAGGV